MTPAELSSAVMAALDDAITAGEISLPADARPSEVKVERPKNREHGDFATNLALVVSKAAGVPPRDVAQVLARRLADQPG
ncbi:MAG TPA: arginine--tRNA ligase, partial [Actinomycetes bacterium]|nr:arginine--tRNA ligase [Actinomycetes bacterium]